MKYSNICEEELKNRVTDRRDLFATKMLENENVVFILQEFG